jgi:homoserine O-acetyltransferase
MEYNIYKLGNIDLQSGKKIENAHLAYKTYGTLNESKSNVILYPTWYSGFISDNEWLIESLNPNKYFIIVIALFGNGESTSPSNNSTFSNCTLYDNVKYQHKLVKELFEIKKIELIIGWSMGAQQCFQWACLYPKMIKRILPFCGSSKTSPHNWIFLESLRKTLEIGNSVNIIKLFASIYAGWGFTQEFYKLEEWKKMGYDSIDDFIKNFWEKLFINKDPKNLGALIWTWQNADISDNMIFKKDLIAALINIKAKVLILSPENDLYFPKEDNYMENKIINDSNLIIIPGIWGHFAGGGINPNDNLFIHNQIKTLLSDI